MPSDIVLCFAELSQLFNVVVNVESIHSGNVTLLSLNLTSLLQKTHNSIPFITTETTVLKDINKFSSRMSPNPEHINFLNDIHMQDQDNEDEEDSGFGSGGLVQRKVFSCRQDHEILIANQEMLCLSGFYYPDLDSIAAMKLLKKSTVGTFLIRNSQDSKYLFALSVKTGRGATSVRIVYHEGWFSFDCDERIRKRMPRFPDVLSLVDHHVQLSRQGSNNSWRWEEKSGRKSMVVDISKPCRISVPSLKHLCTIEVNKSIDQLLPVKLQPLDISKSQGLLNCLRTYPYKI